MTYSACRRLEYADLSFLYAIVQRTHELDLDVIWFVWMMKVSTAPSAVHVRCLRGSRITRRVYLT